MNSLVLIMVAIGVFAMGYRFYAKFLALGIFRIDNLAPTPAFHLQDGHDFVPCNRWLLLAQHAAAVSGGTTLVGTAVAITWGWVPAFLWIVVGSVAAGGAYAIGTLWVSLRYSGATPHRLARELVGRVAATPYLVLTVLVLLLLSTVLTLLLAQFLANHAAIGWLFVLLIPVTIVVRRLLFASSASDTLVNIGLVAAIFIVGLVLGWLLPLSVNSIGAFQSSLWGVVLVRPEHMWGVVVLVTAYAGVKDPIWRSMRPRGVLSGLLIAVTVCSILVGVGVSAADVDAPRINDQAALPHPFVLISLVLTGGAFAGNHALLYTGASVRQLEHQKDAPLLGYGGVVAEALVALTAVMVFSVGFSDSTVWHQLYTSWPENEPLVLWLDEFVARAAAVLSGFGVPRGLSETLIAFVVALSIFCALEGALRCLGSLVMENAGRLDNRSRLIANHGRTLTFVTVAVAALTISYSPLDLDYWYLIGIAGQWLSPAVFALIVIALSRLGRSIMLMAVLPLVLSPVFLWGTLWVMWQWWNEGLWLALITAGMILLLGLWGLIVTTMMAFQIRRQQASAMPLRPPGL